MSNITKSKLFAACARLWKDKAGGVMAYTALALPVLMGVSGLSVDIGSWYMNKRIAQASADAGAIAAGLEVMRDTMAGGSGVSYGVLYQVATTSAGENGYDASGGDTIQINNPPTSGAFAGSSEHVEVTVRRPAQVFLARVLFDESVTVAGRAVAEAIINDTCVWALSRTEDKAVKASGGAVVTPWSTCPAASSRTRAPRNRWPATAAPASPPRG
jgi:uncharacterized membrane protein